MWKSTLKGKKMNCVEMIGLQKVTEDTKGLYTKSIWNTSEKKKLVPFLLWGPKFM